MSRITKYQEQIRDFLKNKSFIKNTRASTKHIIIDMADDSDHFPGVLCLTIINHRCKQDGTKMHGYHIAAGIEAIMMVAKILNNRTYYDSLYTEECTANMITDVISWFYNCLAENIKTLKLSNDDKVDAKTLLNIMIKCTSYTAEKISKIMEQKKYNTYSKMKRTDIFCIDFEEESIDNYRTMKRLDQHTIIKNINDTYGMVCRMAVCLGWLISLGDDCDFKELESLADNMAMIIKMHDDFKNYKRDMRYGDFCTNYIVTHGIKEAMTLFDEAIIEYAEKCVTIGIEIKTCNEIVKVITDYISEATEDMSVDIDTEYDDMSSIKKCSSG